MTSCGLVRQLGPGSSVVSRSTSSVLLVVSGSVLSVTSDGKYALSSKMCRFTGEIPVAENPEIAVLGTAARRYASPKS